MTATEPEDEEPTRDADARFQAGIRARRLEKLEALRARGVEPYPVRFDRDSTTRAVRQAHPELTPGTVTEHTVRLAGRLMAQRRHGGLIFAELRDETGTIQLMVSRDEVGEQPLLDFSDLDLGDWIGVWGTVVSSNHGELSVRLKGFALLSKSLRAFPSIRHGLVDPEARYRRRYLDLALREQTRQTFAIRSTVIEAVRRVLIDRGFQEVETPVLLGQAGGAAARPFVTHHNALDIEMTLRIALELPLKRLIVGGMDRVFEIGRVFRNEGLDTRHNPEFTLLEAYQAFGDYHDMMELTEAIVVTAVTEATGTTIIRVGDREIDLQPPWRRVTMTDLIREHAGVEMHPEMPLADARKIADDLGIPWLPVWGAGKIMSEVYDESSEAKLIEPTFVIDHPREISPLARAHRDDPALVERFELVVAGRELANAYSELNDPVDQAGRFQAEAEQQAGGEEEAEPVDDDYVEALEYGLPPTGGLGIGIDRLVMLIAGQEAIREVILFPTLRPEAAGQTDDLGAVGTERAPSAAEVAAAAAGPSERSPAEVTPAVTAPTRRPRSLRPLAWASVVVAVFSLLPTVTGSRFSIARFGFVSHEVRSVGLIASVVIGIWLIAIARGLVRGKRRAWALSLVLFAAAAVVHLLRGPDPLAVFLSVLMLIALIWFRHDFRAQSDRGSLAQAIAFVPLYLLGVLALTAVTLFANRNQLDPELTVGGVIRTTYGGMIGLQGPYMYDGRVFRNFIAVGLPVLGIAGLLTFLYLVFKTFVQAQPPSPDRKARAERIVHTWGDDTLDYFALRRDKNYYFSDDGRSLIAYLYVRGVAMVAGDPVGPPQDTAQTIDEFLHFCAGRGWRTAFFAVRESDQQIYRDRGMHVIYLGDEAIVSCREFTLNTPAMKDLRAVVRRLDRDHVFELIAETEAGPALVAELNEISEEWRDGAPERGFTMELGQEVEGTQSDFVIAFARERGGRVGGFLRFVPVYGQRPGYSLDLMRRRPDAANGITEYLIARAALGLGARGFDSLSLNFAAWGRLLDSAESAGWSGRMQRLMAKGLNPFFQIQSLRDFNQKFNPTWVPRSVVIDDRSDLPRIALLYASVEGFLDVPVLGRLLEPPLRQRVDAAGRVSEG